ncbi:MAG: tRNA-dihydrouridine synthase [Parcubacteria group bacterium]|nr:tRNA-dihydrouridine synthase [Parcubacteria group bacterium]
MPNFWPTLKKPIVVPAPMDGVTDCAFRDVLSMHGADAVYSEFVSVDGIYHAFDKVKPQMDFTDKQHPYICQIFGKEPALFAHAAKVVEAMGADGVDINFGCPSRRVVQGGSGVKLMTDLDRVYAIVEATCNAVKNIPVSLKIRAGINMRVEDQESNACGVQHMDAIRMMNRIKDLPFSALIMHGRTYEQGFSGVVNTDMVKQVKEIIGDRILLINGSITSPQIAKELLEKSGADGVAIGRGIMGKPWLLQQIKDYLATGTYTEKSWEEIKPIILDHAERIFSQKGNHGMLELRKHLAWYIKGIPQATKARAELVKVEHLEQVKAILTTLP